MFCQHCGLEIRNDEVFCPNCGYPLMGTETKNAASGDQQPAVRLGQPAGPEACAAASTVLTQGILSAAFASTIFLSFLGIIFGIIARGRSNRFAAEFGDISIKARIGRWLSLYGIIAGIALTVFFMFYIAVIVLAFTEGYAA